MTDETKEQTPTIESLYSRKDIPEDELQNKVLEAARATTEHARRAQAAEQENRVRPANYDPGTDAASISESEDESRAQMTHADPLAQATSETEMHKEMNGRISATALEHALDYNHSLFVTGAYCLEAGTLREVDATHLPEGDVFMMTIPDGYSDKEAPFLRPGMCVVQNQKHKHAWVFDSNESFLEVLSNTLHGTTPVKLMSKYLLNPSDMARVHAPTPIEAPDAPGVLAHTAEPDGDSAVAAASQATGDRAQVKPAAPKSTKDPVQPVEAPRFASQLDRQIKQETAKSSKRPNALMPPPDAPPAKLGPDAPRDESDAAARDGKAQSQARQMQMQGGGGGGGFKLPNLGITRALASMGKAAAMAPGYLAAKSAERQSRPEFLLRHMTRTAEEANRRLGDFKAQAAQAGVQVVFERKAPTAKDVASIARFAGNGDGAITLSGFTSQYESLQRMYAEFLGAHTTKLSDPRFVNAPEFRAFEGAMKDLATSAKGVHAPNGENKVAAIDGPIKRMLEMITEKISQILSAVGLSTTARPRAAAR